MAKPKRRISNRRIRPPVEMPEVTGLDSVFARLDELGRSYDESTLRKAHEFASEMHQDQKRRSGEPYMSHPVQVAYILADLKFDQTCVEVGLLHDVLEDTPATAEQIEGHFGEETAGLV